MKRLIGLCLLLFPLFVNAAPTVWHIDKSKSKLEFMATQNGSPITGEFTSFDGTIKFSPDSLSDSQVTIEVDMNSVSASYGEVSSTLKTPDWFNVKVFPKAIFKTNMITKLSDNNYRAESMLTIRNKTVPIVLNFTLDTYNATNAIVEGKTSLQRSMFDVGLGDWKSTEEVKDNVQVTFLLNAKR